MTSPFEKQIKTSLDDSLPSIDVETKQQLQAMRRDAINQPAQHLWLPTLHQWAPITGVAMCCMIAIALWMPSMQSSHNMHKLEQMTMVELMENPEDFDMLSDPGFYLWMDELDAQDV